MKFRFKYAPGDFPDKEDLARALLKSSGPLPHEMKYMRMLGNGPYAQLAYATYGRADEVEEDPLPPQNPPAHVFANQGIRRRHRRVGAAR